MKTAISLPDETFERATRRASDLGISRSEFFARAADIYLDQLDASSVTTQIDAALAEMEADDSNRVAADAGRRVLTDGADGW